MENVLNCPICKRDVYSEVGTGCKMCGMLLEDKSNEFCCKLYMRKYKTINKMKH